MESTSEQQLNAEKKIDTAGNSSVDELTKTFDEDVLCGIQFGCTSNSKR